MLDGKFEALPVRIFTSMKCSSSLTERYHSRMRGNHSDSVCEAASYVHDLSLRLRHLTTSSIQGRPFAWQEAQITLVSIIQHFDLVMDDPTYTLQLKQTLTIKPKDFYIHAIPRKDKPRIIAAPSTVISQAMGIPSSGASVLAGRNSERPGQPLYVLYGSNTGSSEAFAQRIASDAASHG